MCECYSDQDEGGREEVGLPFETALVISKDENRYELNPRRK